MLSLLKLVQWLQHGCIFALLDKIVTNDVKTIIVIIVVITLMSVMAVLVTMVAI